MANTILDDGELRARIIRTIMAPEWTRVDLQIVDAALALGPPTALHAGFPPALGEHDRDPGNVPAMRPAEDQTRPAMLAAYRKIAGPLLPPPGKL